MTTSCQPYQIDILAQPDLRMLENDWQQLAQADRDASFFQSWPWLQTWLQVYQPRILLARARYQDEVVALGVFGVCREKRHHIISVRQLCLLQTGDASQDQLWVEFNDFIGHPEHRDRAASACLHALLRTDSPYDEIIISMMRDARVRTLQREFRWSRRLLSTPGYSTDLRALPDSGYLSCLSRNTRYQITRSRKRYQASHGEIRLQFAKNSAQALQYLAQAGSLHRQKWPNSGFDNPAFVEFHETLIGNYFDSGLIDMVRVTAGEQVIAIIYNILYNNRVYFYLQGLDYAGDGKLKPGLTAHALLIEHYRRQGRDSYDFMGGDSQYKKQLATARENLSVICLQKPRLKLRLENLARNLKETLRKTR